MMSPCAQAVASGSSRSRLLASRCRHRRGARRGAGAAAAGRRRRVRLPLSFNRDIRPILANNCFACHGPDEKQRETKFHFDTHEGAFLEAGVIVPGNAADSMLVQRITHPDPQERMPPRGFRTRADAASDLAAAAMD